MASQTKRKHSETFNTKELRDLCGNIRNDNKEKAFERIRQWLKGRQSCDEISALLQTANMKRNSPVFAPAPAPQEADIHVAQVLPIAGNEAVPQIAEIENELVQQSESEVKMELTQIESNINELKSEMVELKSEMKVELNAFKASVQSDMTEIKSEMKVELNAFKASIQSDMTEIKSMLRQFGAI
eukprot:CAMPEP_0172419400 /NCGR_PEP_ID=MMETSP1064-20121228/5830_1 /TAXON_ID=202472 /ORGANISM="Aulacoseira subarctica , Strain CCAP 1002/5" /LENGTH=184 /DNA_ID=CAMNT_0013158855 /DNA_START=18 /DNA_END=572 /DNA_ORIENTATION=-